jgi:hypothetical protein
MLIAEAVLKTAYGKPAAKGSGTGMAGRKLLSPEINY